MISMLVQMGPGIFQGLLGRNQTQEANALKQNLVRPDMPIAQGYQKQLSMAQNNAQSRYFSGQKNLENRLDTDVAEGVGNMIGRGGSAAGILGGLTELEKKKMDQSMSIGNTALTDWNQRQATLANAYGTMGQQEMNKWAWDKQAKFQADALAAAGLTGAGIQNKAGALQGLSQAAVQFLGSPAGQNLFKSKPGVTPPVNNVKFTQDVENASGMLENPVGEMGNGSTPMTQDQMANIAGLKNTNALTPQQQVMAQFGFPAQDEGLQQPFDPATLPMISRPGQFPPAQQAGLSGLARGVRYTQDVESPYDPNQTPYDPAYAAMLAQGTQNQMGVQTGQMTRPRFESPYAGVQQPYDPTYNNLLRQGFQNQGKAAMGQFGTRDPRFEAPYQGLQDPAMHSMMQSSPATGQQILGNLMNMGLQTGQYFDPAMIKSQNAAASQQAPSSMMDIFNLMMLNK